MQPYVIRGLLFEYRWGKLPYRHCTGRPMSNRQTDSHLQDLVTPLYLAELILNHYVPAHAVRLLSSANLHVLCIYVSCVFCSFCTTVLQQQRSICLFFQIAHPRHYYQSLHRCGFVTHIARSMISLSVSLCIWHTGEPCENRRTCV